MQPYQSSDQLYGVFERLLSRVASDRELAAPLLAGDFVLRLRFRDPLAEITIDLRGDRLRWQLGPADTSADLELLQSAAVAHQFWSGRLNVPLAIASRKIVARGPIAKALALLPAVKPLFAIYREALVDLQLGDVVERGAGLSEAVRLLENGARMTRRLGRRWWRRAKYGAPPAARRSASAPSAGLIPLAERPVVASGIVAGVERSQSSQPCEPQVGESALAIAMLERMLLIRAFEQALARRYADGSIPSEAIHLSIGQEAVAVGCCFALRADDYMATTHRGHGHMLAKGAPADRMMAEIMGKRAGLCGGKGGSMHVTDASVGAIGANGIVGASALLACGAAHSIARQGRDQVAVAFLGDGATNQGMFHEAINFAAVFKLPAVFVVENNRYGEFTALERHTRVGALADRGAAYGVPARTVDGNDVAAVYRAMSEVVEAARSGGGPQLLVCDTYRLCGHMEGESFAYRSEQEIAEWRGRCPIDALRERLLGDQVIAQQRADELVAQAERCVQEALRFADASAEPELAERFSDVYATDARRLYQVSSGSGAQTAELSYAEAIRRALAEEIERDPAVYLLGEDVSGGGYFAVTRGLSERFGPSRIVDTPISEYAIVGSAVGAAITGSRPVAEILFSDFLTTCADPLINNAAKLRYMSGGQYAVPLVVRTPGGAGLGMAAQHSQCLEGLFAGIPGLIVMAPASPQDAYGLLKSAIRSNNPVLFFENKLLYASTGPVAVDGDVLEPIGQARVVSAGEDITIVAISGALLQATAAAAALAERGISVELIDPRTLVPFDIATVLRSVFKTGRLIVVEEAPLAQGFGGEIVAQVVERAFDALSAAPQRIGADAIPIPYNAALERAALPSVEHIVELGHALCHSPRRIMKGHERC